MYDKNTTQSEKERFLNWSIDSSIASSITALTRFYTNNSRTSTKLIGKDDKK